MHDASAYMDPTPRHLFSMSLASRHPLSHLTRSKLQAIILIRLPIPYGRSSFFTDVRAVIYPSIFSYVLSIFNGSTEKPEGLSVRLTCAFDTAASQLICIFSCSDSMFSVFSDGHTHLLLLCNQPPFMQKALDFSATTFETVASDTFYIYRSKLLLSKSPDSYYLRSCIIGIAPNHPGVSIQVYSNGKSYQTSAKCRPLRA